MAPITPRAETAKTVMSPAGSNTKAHRAHRARLPEDGFTLLELLIVLAIIGIVYASLPGSVFSSSASLEVRATARDVADSLRRARGQAIAGNKEVVFFLDVGLRRYGIVDEQKTTEFGENIAVRFTTAREELRSRDEGAIRFFPDGSATGGVVTIDGAQQRLQIKVRWLTGQVALVQ